MDTKNAELDMKGRNKNYQKDTEVQNQELKKTSGLKIVQKTEG